MKTADTLSIVAGLISGVRSQGAIGLLALSRERGVVSSAGSAPGTWLDDYRVRWLSIALTAGEVVGDKLPFTPARTQPAPFAGRLGFGAGAGATVASFIGSPKAPAVVRGAAGAAVSTITATLLRRTLTRATGLPDIVFGLSEDLLVYAAGSWLSKQIVLIQHGEEVAG